MPEQNKADAQTQAASAVRDAPVDAKVDVARAAMQELDQKARDELLEPDQKVTNYIWKTIVVTFAVVLCGATAALVAAVFTTVEAENMQMLLTIFTTAAGILAGFVSGRASTVSRAR